MLKLTGQIAVYKNTDRHLREIYRYAGNTVGELLFTIKTVKKADWDNERYAGGGFSENQRMMVFPRNIEHFRNGRGGWYDRYGKNKAEFQTY